MSKQAKAARQERIQAANTTTEQREISLEVKQMVSTLQLDITRQDALKDELIDRINQYGACYASYNGKSAILADYTGQIASRILLAFDNGAEMSDALAGMIKELTLGLVNNVYGSGESDKREAHSNMVVRLNMMADSLAK